MNPIFHRRQLDASAARGVVVGGLAMNRVNAAIATAITITTGGSPH